MLIKSNKVEQPFLTSWSGKQQFSVGQHIMINKPTTSTLPQKNCWNQVKNHNNNWKVIQNVIRTTNWLKIVNSSQSISISWSRKCTAAHASASMYKVANTESRAVLKINGFLSLELKYFQNFSCDSLSHEQHLISLFVFLAKHFGNKCAVVMSTIIIITKNAMNTWVNIIMIVILLSSIATFSTVSVINLRNCA